MENLGNRYGLIIFDECHHLPSETYSLAARSCLAPYRLGLSATPERADGRHLELEHLIGPIAYRRDVIELAGDYLAQYTTRQIVIELTETERAEYDRERSIYKDFIVSQGIRFSSPTGWADFVIKSSRSSQGRRAMKATYAKNSWLSLPPLNFMRSIVCFSFIEKTERSCLLKIIQPLTRSPNVS